MNTLHDKLTRAEFLALRDIMKVDFGEIHDAETRQSLLKKGCVREDASGLTVTVKGHRQFIIQLADEFEG